MKLSSCLIEPEDVGRMCGTFIRARLATYAYVIVYLHLLLLDLCYYCSFLCFYCAVTFHGTILSPTIVLGVCS